MFGTTPSFDDALQGCYLVGEVRLVDVVRYLDDRRYHSSPLKGVGQSENVGQGDLQGSPQPLRVLQTLDQIGSEDRSFFPLACLPCPARGVCPLFLGRVVEEAVLRLLHRVGSAGSVVRDAFAVAHHAGTSPSFTAFSLVK